MNIIDVAKRYNAFQNNVGQYGEANMDDAIPTLFTESFQKIANGARLVVSRQGLKDQLLAFCGHCCL